MPLYGTKYGIMTIAGNPVTCRDFIGRAKELKDELRKANLLS